MKRNLWVFLFIVFVISCSHTPLSEPEKENKGFKKIDLIPIAKLLGAKGNLNHLRSKVIEIIKRNNYDEGMDIGIQFGFSCQKAHLQTTFGDLLSEKIFEEYVNKRGTETVITPFIGQSNIVFDFTFDLLKPTVGIKCTTSDGHLIYSEVVTVPIYEISEFAAQCPEYEKWLLSQKAKGAKPIKETPHCTVEIFRKYFQSHLEFYEANIMSLIGFSLKEMKKANCMQPSCTLPAIKKWKSALSVVTP